MEPGDGAMVGLGHLQYIFVKRSFSFTKTKHMSKNTPIQAYHIQIIEN